MDKGQAGAIQVRREGEVMAGTDHANPGVWLCVGAERRAGGDAE